MLGSKIQTATFLALVSIGVLSGVSPGFCGWTEHPVVFLYLSGPFWVFLVTFAATRKQFHCLSANILLVVLLSLVALSWWLHDCSATSSYSGIPIYVSALIGYLMSIIVVFVNAYRQLRFREGSTLSAGKSVVGAFSITLAVFGVLFLFVVGN